MTQSSRQMHVEAEMSKYKRVVIRIQFPDRLVMQALFRTMETGQPVSDCLNTLASNDVGRVLPKP